MYKRQAYGFLELLGESTDQEWLTDIGEAGVTRARSRQEEFGKILTDWKDVRNIKTGLQFIQNNAAMSLPYMAITAGSAVAGTLAAPVVGTAGAIGLGITGASTVYTGQIWNEMEGEKNATIAVAGGLAQAALDRLGIGAITGKIPANKLMDAAIAGGTLGAGFTVPGSVSKLAKERAAHGDNVLADETLSLIHI